jgi:ATP-dependent Clp protease ATP-binding subunit ClpA
MFERYAENARQAIFFAREEANKFGSLCIESEHLLLGTMRSCELELNELLKLTDLEGALRGDLAASAQLDATSKRDVPLSNQSKRILTYAAEEAVRLNSLGIGSGHLLLGILRESEGVASRFLLAHDVDLLRARQMIAMLSRSHTGDTGQVSPLRTGWANTARLWIGAAAQFALLVTGAIWFAASLAWNLLGPSSFFWSFGKRSRAIAMAISYAFFFLYQLLMFGWLIPLGVGIYRVTMR